MLFLRFFVGTNAEAGKTKRFSRFQIIDKPIGGSGAEPPEASFASGGVYGASEKPCGTRLSLQEPPTAPTVQAVPVNLKKVP